VPRDQAVARVAAAVDARNEADTGDGGPVIIARTDAGREDFDEALIRAQMFHEAGADITFVEAPRSMDELRRISLEVSGLKFANMLEQGDTPIVSPSVLKELGFSIVAYPLTLLSASIKAQELALQALMTGEPNEVQVLLKDFSELREIVGFDDYYRREDKFKA
jgi:2-methylisocitrate lyase-like PEP mutase family enzyme